jgi:hypothetical protein
MGNTHFRSNVLAEGTCTASFPTMKTDTLTVNTTMTMPSSTAVTTPNLSGGSYLKMGTRLFMYWGTAMWTATVASLVASMEGIMTTLSGAASPLPGCLFINATTVGDLGGLWVRGDTAASWMRAQGPTG